MKKYWYLILLLTLLSCAPKSNDIYVNNNSIIQTSYGGTIYLYGEKHGKEKIINKEFKAWQMHYKNGMRHLFLETPYYTAQYLNLWMKENDDTKLNEIYSDWEGTAAHNINHYEFYKKIKELCPETIFHGTDIGHQYFSTGKRYLTYLEKNEIKETGEYLITKDTIKQGMYYYESDYDEIYRENKMVENFIRELSKINNENIMGIYGAAHTKINKLDYTRSIPCMANQLNSIFTDQIKSINLSKWF